MNEITNQIDLSFINKIGADARLWRQDLHDIPELSFEEVKTTKYIKTKLEKWGVQVDCSLTKTGLIASFVSSQNVPTIAIRADIDALAMGADKKQHACGHDGHTAILLGVAKYLARKQSPANNVILIFQAAEEGSGTQDDSGAKKLVKSGFFRKYKIDQIYTLHNVPSLPAHYISIKKGALLAGQNHFFLTIKGKKAHASQPSHAVSAITPLADLSLALHQYFSDLPPTQAVAALTQVSSGSAINIIPDLGQLGGSIRSFDREKMLEIQKSVQVMSKKICDIYGVDLKMVFQERTPPVINDDKMVEKAWKAAEGISSATLEKGGIQVFASDDFAHYLEYVDGCYVSLGTGTKHRVHTDQFIFNDDVIPTAIEFWLRLIFLEDN